MLRNINTLIFFKSIAILKGKGVERVYIYY